VTEVVWLDVLLARAGRLTGRTALPTIEQGREKMPDSFENVTIVKKANIYFDGKVTSRTVLFPDGFRKTLGIMMPGEYEFGTDSRETMKMLSGEMKVLLPGSSGWQTFKAGESFEVPAHSSFKLELDGVVDYCCSYG
jgi:purine/pyrimidine-nucleoside phosphorylase